MTGNSGQRGHAIERLRPYIEQARSFSGWSFDELDVGHLDPGPPWDYEALVRRLAPSDGWALDIGTGGGEVLSRLRDALPQHVVATEAWRLNAPVARERLHPLGIDVVHADSLRLPFRDALLTCVIDRHEELEPAEVARVLAPGGRFITQQVGNDNWCELRAFFPRMTDFGDHHLRYATGLREAGLTVTRNERHQYRVAFGSLGDLVFMLCVAPWEIPDFDVERDLDALLAVEAACGEDAGIVLTETRYLLVAECPQ